MTHKTYLDPAQFGESYAIIPGDGMGDPYGTEVSYIHAKFGDVRKCYNFTDECRARFPEFVAAYDAYWTDRTSGPFKSADDVVDYLIAHPDAGAEIKPYFNYVDEWCDGWDGMKQYLTEQNKPDDK